MVGIVEKLLSLLQEAVNAEETTYAAVTNSFYQLLPN